MAIAVIAFCMLSFVYFLYESIVAPSLRLGQRYDLFKLRDELRRLTVDHAAECDDAVFAAVQDYLNTGLRLLPRLNLSLVHAAHQAFESDARLRQVVEERRHLVGSCPIPRVPAILDHAHKVSVNALLVNTGGWFIWLVPGIVVLVTFQRLQELFRNVLMSPPQDLEDDGVLAPPPIKAAFA